MARHWLARFIIKLLRTLNCFTGSDEVEDVPPLPAAALCRPLQPVDAALLPGLPDSLVLEYILPRIPWYSRPLLRATSRAWIFALDNLSRKDQLLARQSYNNKEILHTDHGNLVQVKHARYYQYAIQLYDPRQKTWRNVPPIPCGSLPPTAVFVGFLPVNDFNTIMVDYLLGKMVAASVFDVNEDECVVCVWTIDIEGGMWKWEQRPSIYTKRIGKYFTAHSNIVDVEGKLYILRYHVYEKIKPVVYDVASDEWMESPEAPPWPPEVTNYRTTYRRDPRTGKISKIVYAVAPRRKAYLDTRTHTWNSVD